MKSRQDKNDYKSKEIDNNFDMLQGVVLSILLS